MTLPQAGMLPEKVVKAEGLTSSDASPVGSLPISTGPQASSRTEERMLRGSAVIGIDVRIP